MKTCRHCFPPGLQSLPLPQSKRRFPMRRSNGNHAITLSSLVLMLALLTGIAHSQTYSVFFDDFNYQSSSDPTLLSFGWAPRSGGGGPGIGTWDPTHITFIPDPANSSNQLMQMTATTDGTA